MRRSPSLSFLILAAWMAVSCMACATNPVTGKKQFSLTSEKREIAVGERHYPIAIETAGGRFTTDPDLGPYVESVGHKVAQAGPRPNLPYAFAVTNDSKPHAFALPGGKIGVSRGLLVLLENEGQLAAVLGHQVVHAAARHETLALERDTIQRAAIITVALGATLAGIPALPLVAFSGRKGTTTQRLVHMPHDESQEILADRHAMKIMQKTGYPPKDRLGSFHQLASWQHDRALEEEQGSVFAAHPISRKRLAAARLYEWKVSEEEPSPTVPEPDSRGERYLAKTTWLRSIQRAYDVYDAGFDAYLDADYERAHDLAFEATDMVPEEPTFHALRGHILMKQGRFDEAFESYDRFVALRPESASAWARRGLARKAQGDYEGAFRDFQMSSAIKTNPIAARELEAWRLGRESVAQADVSAPAQAFRAQRTSMPSEMGGPQIEWVPVASPDPPTPPLVSAPAPAHGD